MADMFDSAPLPKAPPPLLQSEAFARAMTATGLCPHRLGDQTLVTSRRMPGGVVLPQIQRAVLDPLRLPDLVHEAGLGRRPMLLAPDRPCPKLSRISAVRLQRDRSVFELHLDADIGLDAPFQRRLSHAQAQGLTIRRCNLPMDPGHWIFDMATQQPTSRRHLPPSLLTLAYAAANPGGAKLFTARLGQTRIAALLVLIHGQAATWHMSHTTPHGVARGADVLLLWDAARALANAGVQRFDLGAFDRRNPGANAFRQGAGAHLRRTGGLWLWWPPLGKSRRSLSKTNARSPGIA